MLINRQKITMERCPLCSGDVEGGVDCDSCHMYCIKCIRRYYDTHQLHHCPICLEEITSHAGIPLDAKGEDFNKYMRERHDLWESVERDNLENEQEHDFKMICLYSTFA